jgi:two-component system sensor histidine kinase VicK
MRWWLALAFAGIAILTALAVAQVFTTRSESAIRERAQELVAGAAVAAASQVATDASAEDVTATLARFGRTRELALFAFAPDGSLLTPERSQGVSLDELPNLEELLATALEGRRLVETIDDGKLVSVALPMRKDSTAALIAVASRSDFEDALGIVRNEIVSAAFWATLIGATVGLVVALLITRRLRRIGTAAAAIEQGRFDVELSPGFHDELGDLAETIDRMREHLSVSFERLEGERDRLGRLLEQLEEGVIAVDHELVVEFANSRAQALVGPTLSPGNLLPDPWPTFSLREEMRSLFASGGGTRTERVSPDAASTFVIVLLPPSVGSSTGVIVVSDVTEQERRERAEREFVTNAAHELRTPIAAIASAVEVLQQGAKEQPSDRDRFLEVVERQTGRLTRLAHALLTLARAQTRAEPINLEPVLLAPLVREIAEAEKDVRIGVELQRDDIEVLAHRDLLFQALANLTANARKHAGSAGLTLRVTEDGMNEVRIDVVDSGHGMTRLEAYRALDRFYRGSDSDGQGFGLGLPIAREIITAMGGMLSIDSAPGEGTTASISLPAVATSPAQGALR